MSQSIDAIEAFVKEISRIHETGAATEHSYRAALQELLSSLKKDTNALNEPKRVECGAPDFFVYKGDIVIGHVEAKDIGVGLRGMKGANKQQQDRYRAALPNLIYTNGLDWDFYRDSQRVASVTIADYHDGIQPLPDRFEELHNLLHTFIEQRPQTIKSPRDLAERMAGKARLIKDVLYKALRDDKDQLTAISAQHKAFQENLIHDISREDFADIYAETIAYGMFAARLHDRTLDDFSRQEALQLLPKTNPFLRSLFGYIAGHDLDDRIAWIIDDLADVFQACDVSSLMNGFGTFTGKQDPFLHFYETFLAAYNSQKRKARGVWYTPEPVVNFIVRAVDEVLRTDFGLSDGLADTSKVTIDWDTGQKETTKTGKIKKSGKNAVIQKEVHRVQVLDPATGTGTFLSEVIKQIAPHIQGVAPGMWPQYVEDDLIPRLHGFELLMASYAMCHMKLDMILTEMGYEPTGNPPRLSVYLTNSLEEGEPANQTLPFARWISHEAKGANTIKRDMPIMCVIGNPPYSGISQNMGEWISDLIEDYKYVDGVHFGERKHWLHDDYVKFIRLAESLLEKNGDGVLGFITNHGYLDNPTFRGMRWHLLKTFDRIHVLDLHGNANKKEVTPEGLPDRNVFDIQQGVAIIIAVKTGEKNHELAKVHHGDLWGTREQKYEALATSPFGEPITKPIDCSPPQYAFVPRDFRLAEVYQKGFGLAKFMPTHVTGIVTARDKLVIGFTEQALKNRISRFVDPSKTDDEIRAEFFPNKKPGKYPPGDSRGWKLPAARAALQKTNWTSDIAPIAYRPFDKRAILYRPDMIDWGRFEHMQHMLSGNNLALLTTKAHRDDSFAHAFVCQDISEVIGLSPRTASNSVNFPLYLYRDKQDFDQEHSVNFNQKLYKKLQKHAENSNHGVPDELAVFDYIYGVLHCPAYRDLFAEFLRIDFPRIPWPANSDEFWNVSSKGAALRKLHLMDQAAIGQTPYPFMGPGDNVVDKPRFEHGKVWINNTQYFDNAPEVAWGFYIGGYQPAQKWLKDRKHRALTFDDVKHYQRILKVLLETDRIMHDITMDLPD